MNSSAGVVWMLHLFCNLLNSDLPMAIRRSRSLGIRPFALMIGKVLLCFSVMASLFDVGESRTGAGLGLAS